jgi:hypothetical protein
MTYGLSTRVPREDGREGLAAHANPQSSMVKAWRALDEARRFALIECALNPANDRIDGFPLAL